MLGPILAQSAPSAPFDLSNQAVFIGALVLGLLALAKLVDTVDNFVQRRRRTPPLDQELAGFATKIDLANADGRLSAEIADVRKHISTSHNLIYQRIESEAKSTRADIDRVGEKTNEEISNVRRTVEAEFRALYRALGKVEGNNDGK